MHESCAQWELKCPEASLVKMSSLHVRRPDLWLDIRELVFSERPILRMLLEVQPCRVRESKVRVLSCVAVLAARMLGRPRRTRGGCLVWVTGAIWAENRRNHHLGVLEGILAAFCGFRERCKADRLIFWGCQKLCVCGYSMEGFSKVGE